MCRSFGVCVLLMMSDFKNTLESMLICSHGRLQALLETNEVVFIHFLCVLVL